MNKLILKKIKLLISYSVFVLFCLMVYNKTNSVLKSIDTSNTGVLSELIKKSNSSDSQDENTCKLDYNCDNGRSVPMYSSPRNKKIRLFRMVNRSKKKYTEIVAKYPEMSFGGKWSPSGCTSRSNLAIIVPFRKRDRHLMIFLDYIIPFLQRQKSAFTIFIIDQQGKEMFNRAALLNIGYLEASKYDNYSCYIFHDVDLLPEDWCNLYTCSNQPKHLAYAMNKFRYNLPYSFYVGGILALSKPIVEKINGFTNTMFGWGGEDDDTYARLRKHGYNIERYNGTIGRYTMIRHKRDSENPVSDRSQYDVTHHWLYSEYDGLSSVNYTVLETKPVELFTRIMVQIPGPTKGEEIPSYFKQNELHLMVKYYKDQKNKNNKNETEAIAEKLNEEMKSYARPKMKT